MTASPFISMSDSNGRNAKASIGRSTQLLGDRAYVATWGEPTVNKITRIDASRCVFDIHRDLSVSARASKPGPPERIDGMTIGIVTMVDKSRSKE